MSPSNWREVLEGAMSHIDSRRAAIISASAIAASYAFVTYARLGPQDSFIRKLLGLKLNYPVHGFVHPGYELVKEEFEKNFEQGLELGSSFCAYADGKLVVELYGGYHDIQRSKRYDSQSLQLIFSSGKTLMAILIAHLVDKDLIDLNKRVADYWPEFAEGGKENVTVKELLAHRGGVGWLDEPHRLTTDEYTDLDLVSKKIAGQPHNHNGKPVHDYNAQTRGFFLNQIVRRVDPKKRSAGQIYREDINPKLGVEVYMGLPEALYTRVSPLVSYPFPRVLIRALLPAWITRNPLPPILDKIQAKKGKALFTPNITMPGAKGNDLGVIANSYDYQKGEGPSYNTITTAKSMAKLGAVMANGGTLDGFKLCSPKTLAKVYEEMELQEDYSLCFPFLFTAGGFNLLKDVSCPDPDMLEKDRVGKYRAPGTTWVGWGGYGGSLIYWSPSDNLAVGYAENQLGLCIVCEARSERLSAAVWKCHNALSKGKK
ncbi:hypothetical protein SmJEL517_g04442 [Synchytrium microbalum]|uniref:Beta-lactamase-related domain-containing protein n=1 Tax=Synchytrium microbalum TaxID=1806994 RepID=A0A507BZZ5_9FUNG|nr:uncharacterized protein SmJEL517_g04442 [Synchytrium microbalum]TPX32409.1 hypothetical protein SmJEL517_g04442 [Synchytrium microbalum]